MSSSYKVLAPYVTMTVKDVSGQPVVLGYYQGGIVHNPVDQKHVDALVDLGMVEEAPAPADPEPAPQPEKPAGNASQEVWAAYAVTQGASADEVKDLKQTELRELYG